MNKNKKITEYNKELYHFQNQLIHNFYKQELSKWIKKYHLLIKK